MRLKKTERGFKRGEFVDLNCDKCSIQESSLATSPAIWLGCDTVSVVTGHKSGARMHLDRKMASQLIKHLQKFVSTGHL